MGVDTSTLIVTSIVGVSVNQDPIDNGSEVRYFHDFRASRYPNIIRKFPGEVRLLVTSSRSTLLSRLPIGRDSCWHKSVTYGPQHATTQRSVVRPHYMWPFHYL